MGVWRETIVPESFPDGDWHACLPAQTKAGGQPASFLMATLLGGAATVWLIFLWRSVMQQAPERLTYPRLLSIAGSDSSGGAGIQADLKTFAALGCYGMTAITAITAQNTTGVQAIAPTAPDILQAQIDSVMSDVGCDAIKIGMVFNAESMRVVAASLRQYGVRQVVLDPVVVATAGSVLMEDSAAAVMLAELAPLCRLMTPNLDEARFLTGQSVESPEDMRAAAHQLLRTGAGAVLVKGGHLPGDTISDILVMADGSEHVFADQKIHTRNTHGTGCTLSSAIAAFLALGKNLPQAVQLARAYVRAALQAGAEVQTGHGYGPVNHGFAPQAMQLVPRA